MKLSLASTSHGLLFSMIMFELDKVYAIRVHCPFLIQSALEAISKFKDNPIKAKRPPASQKPKENKFLLLIGALALVPHIKGAKRVTT